MKTHDPHLPLPVKTRTHIKLNQSYFELLPSPLACPFAMLCRTFSLDHMYPVSVCANAASTNRSAYLYTQTSPAATDRWWQEKEKFWCVKCNGLKDTVVEKNEKLWGETGRKGGELRSQDKQGENMMMNDIGRMTEMWIGRKVAGRDFRLTAERMKSWR